MTFTMGSNNDIGLAEISALLAALGIAIYALGMVALCWPIYRRITQNASTALFAVSLMPKTVVAGQGVRLLFSLPFLNTVLWITLAIAQGILFGGYEYIVRDYGSWVLVVGIIVIGVITYGAYVVVIILMTSVFNAIEVPGGGRWSTGLSYASATVMGIVTAFLTLNTFFESDAILPRFPGWETGLRTTVLIFLLNCVTAFILAFAGDPPLPEIALNSSTTVEGKLVAHADGIWYFLDNNGKLVGIPDEKAGRVLIFPN